VTPQNVLAALDESGIVENWARYAAARRRA